MFISSVIVRTGDPETSVAYAAGEGRSDRPYHWAFGTARGIGILVNAIARGHRDREANDRGRARVEH